jgi:hypothetical protein
MPIMSSDHVNAVKPFNGWPHPGTILRQNGFSTTGTGVTNPKSIGVSSNSSFRGSALSAISATHANPNAGLKNMAQKALGSAALVAKNASRPENYLSMVRKLRF